MKKDHDQRLICLINADFFNHTFVEREKDKSLFYLPLASGGEGLAAAGGAPVASARANASIAIFQLPNPKPVALDGLFFDVDRIGSRCPSAIVAT
jgi:hypothetical protein